MENKKQSLSQATICLKQGMWRKKARYYTRRDALSHQKRTVF